MFYRAFCQAENVPRLDHFFSLVFQRAVRLSILNANPGHGPQYYDACSAHIVENLPGVRWLSLPEDVKVIYFCVFIEVNILDVNVFSKQKYNSQK